MTTNFRLNNKIKAKLAIDLTAKAVEKKMKALEKKLCVLNIEFWNDHDKRVAEVLKIDIKRYDELLQCRALIGTTTLPVENLSSGSTDGIFNEDERHLRTSIEYRLQLHTRTFLKRNPHHCRQIGVMFQCNHTVPTIAREFLSLADRKSCKIYAKAEKLMAEYVAIMRSGFKFHSDVTSLLYPVRSYKKLLEVFPEAAKLIAHPAKSSTEVLPKQLVDEVRERLMNGIPD